MKLPNVGARYRDMGQLNSDLRRGLVRCSTCGQKQKVDSGECIRTGWPKCCGSTMSLIPVHDSEVTHGR